MDTTDNVSHSGVVLESNLIEGNLVNFDMEPAKVVDEVPTISLEPPLRDTATSLEPPLRDSAPSFNNILGSPSKTRPSSVIATKNTRKRMEDRHVVLHDLKAYLPSNLQDKIDSDEHVSYYAVFDGHAGTDAAAHAAAHLHELVIESSAYPSDPVQAFHEAFVKCDSEFVAKSKKSGTTAICSLIKGSTIFTAWLGDSQAVLIRNGVPVKIVEAHKPNRDDEKARIEALGGTIMHWGTWRVNGQLAVSRAIGDGEYKPYISAEPDVTTSVNNGSEEFLILGCDGLWDTITPEEATDLVFQHLEENKMSGGDIENIGARLATAAKDKGSGDNITIIVIFIKPVEEVISLGKRQTAESSQPDIAGISSTSDYVFSESGTRDSLEPSKDRPDFTSPNVSFANLEGGQMFSPDPFGNVDNGFNLSSEQFNNQIDDKRFSNESERVSDENFNGNHMEEMLKQQSIAKVEDLFKMLDREDSSPTPEEEDARPLEEILAAAREQPQDDVDGVEDDDDSSDDEIVDFGACNELNEGAGNAKLEEVLKLDDKSLSEEQEETDTFAENKDAFAESRQALRYQEPRMDPCEQVTVKETGPQEYSTIVPPAQEMPTFQQPVIEIVDPMTCSMVQEESEQESTTEVKTNGDVQPHDIVTFDSNEPEGFMLKTPGQNGGELLAQFTPDQVSEPETDPVAPVTEGVASLSIPELAVTPATPVKERSPDPSPRKDSKTDEAAEEVKPSKEESEKPPETSSNTEKKSVTPASPIKKATPGSPTKKATPGSRSVPAARTNVKAPSSVLAKSAPVKKDDKPTKPTPARTAASTKPASTVASRITSTRPTSASAAGRPKPGVKAVDEAKSTKSGSSTSSATSTGVKRQTPKSVGAKPLERKPMPSKPDSASRKPAVPRTDLSKPKTETKDKIPARRPASSTLPSNKTVSATPGVSRQTSSASSASSSRPRPASNVSRPGVTASRPSNTATAAKTGDEAKKGTPAASRLTSSRTSSSSLRQTTSSSGPTKTSSGPGLKRTTSATVTRAATSSTAVKPTAAAERVAAARAAAMSKAPPKPKTKASTTKKAEDDTSNPTEDIETKPTEELKINNEEKVNGHSVDGKEPEPMITDGKDDPGDKILVKDEIGDSRPEANGNGDTQTVNGLAEVSQSEC